MASGLMTSLARRMASRLVYSEHGVPSQVVSLEKFTDPKANQEDDVVVKVLAVPVHPSHINTIQGFIWSWPDLKITIAF